MLFIDYIYTEDLIYMFSSINKRGDIESTTSPYVVLVINNNMYAITLMILSSIFQEKFNDDLDKDCEENS